MYKYLIRMSTRSTPYGTFAGCAIGYLSKGDTNIDIHNITINKVSRIDMGVFAAFTDILPFLNKSLLQQTIFFTNTSIYTIRETYRYYEYKIVDGKRKYYLSSFSKNEYINCVISVLMLKVGILSKPYPQHIS